MKISKQTWFIIGGSVAMLGILGYLYISNKSKKAALAAAQAKLAEEEAKGPTVVTKYITVTPKTTTTSSSTSTTTKPLNTSTWTVGDVMYANYDNVVLANYKGKLTFNDGDVVGTFQSMETVNGVQLAHVKNANGQIYYVGATFLTN